jgi:hypothetical protein
LTHALLDERDERRSVPAQVSSALSALFVRERITFKPPRRLEVLEAGWWETLPSDLLPDQALRLLDLDPRAADRMQLAAARSGVG